MRFSKRGLMTLVIYGVLGMLFIGYLSLHNFGLVALIAATTGIILCPYIILDDALKIEEEA